MKKWQNFGNKFKRSSWVPVASYGMQLNSHFRNSRIQIHICPYLFTMFLLHPVCSPSYATCYLHVCDGTAISGCRFQLRFLKQFFRWDLSVCSWNTNWLISIFHVASDSYVLRLWIISVSLREQLKGSMQEPDNFHFYCFEKNAVKVFSRASVNKVLTKYCKSINQVIGSTCTKICINIIVIYRYIWFLHETRSPLYDAQSANTRNESNLSRYCTRKVGSWRNVLFGFLVLTVTKDVKWTSSVSHTWLLKKCP